MDRSIVHWLVALRRESDSQHLTLEQLAHATEHGSKRYADVSAFHVPALRVGTLDSLMQLSDDLIKVDSSIEGLLHKCERQIIETHSLSSRYESSQNSKSKSRKSEPILLKIESQVVAEYLSGFMWDSELWDELQPLPTLIQHLTATAESADRELRSFAAAYQEKISTIAALERNTSGPLLNANLEYIITDQVLSNAGLSSNDLILNSEFLKTVAVIVPKSLENVFKESYETLDGTSVPLGPENDRDSVHGSPVVPRSAVKLLRDGEYSLFIMTALVKYLDNLKETAKKQKFVIREFDYDPSRAMESATAVAEIKREADSALMTWREDADRKFGELFSIWMHVKTIRTFVEAVLRYGLPTDYCYAIVTPKKGHESKLQDSIRSAYRHIDEGFDPDATVESSNADDMNALEQSLAMSLPIVALPFASKAVLHIQTTGMR